MQSSKKTVMAAAQELLSAGLEAQSQAEVASALQIFFNAGCLKEVRPHPFHTAATGAAVSIQRLTAAESGHRTADSRGLTKLCTCVRCPVWACPAPCRQHTSPKPPESHLHSTLYTSH